MDYIICECGDNFPDEDALKEHLANEHGIVKAEKPTSPEPELDDTTNEEVVKYEEVLQEEDVQEEEDQPTEYFIENSSLSTLQFIMPEGIKTENIVVQYMDENGALITSIQDVALASCSNEESQDSLPTSNQTRRKVVFRKEQIQEQVVIIGQENTEHDYDNKEVDTNALTQYRFCEVCGKSFKSERSVKIHFQRKHVKPGDKKTNQYKPKKNAVCEVCGKKYVCNAALSDHMNLHTGERPYTCQECLKTFTSRLYLQLHTRTHTGERPYQCTQCPKAFSNQAALLRHDRVHTGVKPYACPVCGKTFTQSNSMKLHYQTVHLRMPAPYKSAARRKRDEVKQLYVEHRVRGRDAGGFPGSGQGRVEVVARVRKSKVPNIIARNADMEQEEVVYYHESTSRPQWQEAAIKSRYHIPQNRLLFRHGSQAPHYNHSYKQDVTDEDVEESDEYEMNS
ncbi:hypothetical protein O0L34_g10651 [Tuta absoluta]|nr:hypothetical protein O0L34_g10651 [Tuta absoluta]